jgi:hypothetical protein
MDYAIVAVPAAPVRRKPNHRKEMVNQLLFGEAVEIRRTKDVLWVKVRSLHDNYEGWMTRNLLKEVDAVTAADPIAHVTSDLLSLINFGDTTQFVPVGSSLPFFEPVEQNKTGTGMLGDRKYELREYFHNREIMEPTGEVISALTKQWLNAPYLWGGRTPLGVDCSGFVQVIYKLMGIDLPRDAWQQAQEGKGVKHFSEARPGDLVFFDNKEDIVHVGIILEDNQIIHASGKVRLDMLTKKGIVNSETGKRTLRLRAIRRIF